MLSFNLVLEFFKIRLNIYKAGAEIEVHIKPPVLLRKKTDKQTNLKSNTNPAVNSQGKEMVMGLPKKSC